MLVVVQEQERDPPGRRLPRLLIGNSKGRLFRIAPDEEQRVGFASGASWSYPGGVEVYAQASVAAAVRRTFVSHQNGGRSTRIRSRGAAEAVGAVVVSLGMALVGFPMLARTFPTVQLFQKSEKDLLPEMHFGSVDYAEPSLVWYFRSRVHGLYWALKPEHVEKFMAFSGPKFVIMPTAVARTIYPELPPGWKSYTAQGYNFAKGNHADLTMILKPTE